MKKIIFLLLISQLLQAQPVLFTYSNNIGLGLTSLSSLTSGLENTSIGHRTLQNLTTGGNNSAIGADCMRFLTSGNYNIGNGTSTLAYNQTGCCNTAIGYAAGACSIATNSSHNVYIGFFTAENNADNTGFNVFLGDHAGYYGSWNNTFFLDNGNRIDSATQVSSSLMVGTFSSTIANQRLRFNSQLGINTTSTEKLTVAGRIRSTNSDIVVEDNSRGFILKDNKVLTPHYWRIKIDSLGSLNTTDLGTTLPTE